MSWKVYIIYNKNYSYCGATPDIEKRIKKHNQELPGGAKYTRMIGPNWNYICYIEGFKEKKDALRFEWAVKHCAPKKAKGIYNRIKKLEKVLNKEYWTSKSPNSIDYELSLIWCDITFIPENIIIPKYIKQDISKDILG
jgi:predicted GIY-YIG superfamily endonuclease